MTRHPADLPRNAPVRAAAVALALAGCAPAAAQPASTARPAFENRLTGDLGAGVFARGEVARGTGASTTVLPYVYADYGRFFGRVDTFGVKTLPLGAGYLELVARIGTEGFDADVAPLRGVGDRRAPVPIGIGTQQRTPIGAFFVYAMHDLTSGGALLEATWGTRFDVGRVTLFPLLGVEHRTRAYVRHLYGIDAAASAASGLPAYAPGASTVPMAGVAAEVPIAGPWALQLQWRHRWLGDAIGRSPIVGTRSLDSGHAALTYTFR